MQEIEAAKAKIKAACEGKFDDEDEDDNDFEPMGDSSPEKSEGNELKPDETPVMQGSATTTASKFMAPSQSNSTMSQPMPPGIFMQGPY